MRYANNEPGPIKAKKQHAHGYRYSYSRIRMMASITLLLSYIEMVSKACIVHSSNTLQCYYSSSSRAYHRLQYVPYAPVGNSRLPSCTSNKYRNGTIILVQPVYYNCGGPSASKHCFLLTLFRFLLLLPLGFQIQSFNDIFIGHDKHGRIKIFQIQ